MVSWIGTKQRARPGLRAGAAVVAILAVAGCGGTTVTAPPPAPPSVAARTPTPKAVTPSATPTEDRVFQPGIAPVTIRTAEGAGTLELRRYSWQRTAFGNHSAPPKERYLILDVVFTATEGKMQVNPLYFSGRSRTGVILQPTLGADGNEPVLSSHELNAGQSVDGLVTFDAPTTEITVVLSDEVGEQVAQLRIPAPRD
ncbi:hypothetical protein AADG42_15990 [Ammonicoccus fulvus]|uniref:DUF4352 domain-containing protein n=1 Tax=Ammonicoccus fulvus TaxID=3138240 RepID=A0ABZ3FRL9_9ACTN